MILIRYLNPSCLPVELRPVLEDLSEVFACDEVGLVKRPKRGAEVIAQMRECFTEPRLLRVHDLRGIERYFGTCSSPFDWLKIFFHMPAALAEVEFFQLFNMGYQNYSQGEWQVARRMLPGALFSIPICDTCWRGWRLRAVWHPTTGRAQLC